MTSTTGLRETLTDRERVTAMSAAYPDDKADLTWAEIEELLSPGSGEQVSEALHYAQMLAAVLHAKHYSHITDWKPLPDLLGLLTQIDNMTAPLSGSMAGPVPEGWKGRRGDYPVGTKAYSVNGGHWTRVVGGWKWHCGDTFPMLSADAFEVEIPAPALPEAKPVAWVVLLNYGDGRWSGEMLTDHLPSDDPTQYKIVRPLYVSPDREAATREAVTPGLIRVCPERDGRCPHGVDCPFAIDRYRCDMDASRRALAQQAKP